MIKLAVTPLIISLSLLAGCTTSKPVNPEFEAQKKAAFDKLFKDAKSKYVDIYGKEITRTGKTLPNPNNAPPEPVQCKKLVDKKREMILSVRTVNMMELTNLRAWGYFYYDVLPNGTTSNIRLIQSSGGKATDADFKTSIASWTYLPNAGAKNCVAEMILK